MKGQFDPFYYKHEMQQIFRLKILLNAAFKFSEGAKIGKCECRGTNLLLL